VDPETEFCGPNAAWVRDLYRRYLADDDSLDPATREAFRHRPALRLALQDGAQAPRLYPGAAALRYLDAIRTRGHRIARLDPLALQPRGDPALDPATWGLDEASLRALPASLDGGPGARSRSHLAEVANDLCAVYTASSGFRFDAVEDPEQRAWLRAAVEARRFRPPRDPVDGTRLLKRLTDVEGFERFLHGLFPGRTRFSIEGVDMAVPMLDELVGLAAERGMHNLLLGCTHRGRLTILAHVLGFGAAPVLADFRHHVRADAFRDDYSWSGDVTYHQGARHTFDTKPTRLEVTVPPNASHVELVDPVLQGMARAAGTDAKRPGAPRFDPVHTLPVQLHGDAAIAGQGIAHETLNLAALDGYRTGGTIHLVLDNRLGYTTEPDAGRSTRYASDLARGFDLPVVLVNADEPLACLEAVRLAFAWRERFGRDVVIDLVGYRRRGHNEGDEPSFTQPLRYARIREHPTVRALWARRLVEDGVIDDAQADAFVRKRRHELESALDGLEPEAARPEPGPGVPDGAPAPVTGVALERLREIHAAVLDDPGSLALHPKIARARARRSTVLDEAGEPRVAWAAAEDLALATILADGIAVRMTGEDVERGTFSQRHAVLHDTQSGARHVPLQHFAPARAAFAIHDSPLTESATLGFEYGYSVRAPGRLVVWEAQYGDFVNGAQAVIDEFVVAGARKWRQRPALVLLLPHGYEGQGPDHSSARLERWLSLGDDVNLRVVQPTTAAQYFHLLRDQAARLGNGATPLVVLTPKGLLRHEATASTPRALAEGRFAPILDDGRTEEPGSARRLVLCSGRIHVDLAQARPEGDDTQAIARVELLHPFPAEAVEALFERYAEAREVVWAQEEPANMGAWPDLRPRLQALAGGRTLRYVGRTRSCSPAEGASALHADCQRSLAELVFEPGAEPAAGGIVMSRVIEEEPS